MTLNDSLLNDSGATSISPPLISASIQFTSDRITTIFFICLFIPCIIGGNLLVIMAVVKTRQLRTTTNTFVVSLAVTDVFVGVISLPIYLAFRIKGHVWIVKNYGPALQKIWNGVDTITGVTSMFNLMNISIDRYICINYPFRYHSMMTTRVTALLVIFSWLYGFFNYSLVFLQLRPKTHILILTVLAYFIPLLIIILAYFSIARVAGKQSKMIKSLHRKETKGTVSSFLKELKATWVLAVVVSAFILCWSGTFVVNLKYAICRDCSACKCTTSEKIINMVKMFQYFGSVVNPFIYTSLNKDFRKAIKNFLPGTKARRSSASSGTVSIRYTVQEPDCSDRTRLKSSIDHSSNIDNI